jgi:hypothetical protein
LGNIGELTIICKGAECPTIQEDDEITVGKFSVRHIDGHSDVFLKTLNAGSVYFNILEPFHTAVDHYKRRLVLR